MTPHSRLQKTCARACQSCAFKVVILGWNYEDASPYAKDDPDEDSRCLLNGPSFVQMRDVDAGWKAPYATEPCTLRVAGRAMQTQARSFYEIDSTSAPSPLVAGLIAQGATRQSMIRRTGRDRFPIDVATRRIQLLLGADLGSAHVRARFLRHVPSYVRDAAQDLLDVAEKVWTTQDAMASAQRLDRSTPLALAAAFRAARLGRN